NAWVEVRRLSGRLGVLADVRGHGRRYRDDAFAQWLCGMLYQEAGDTDDASLAFLDVERQGSFASGDLLDFSLPAAGGEIVVLHFAGLVPERTERRLTIDQIDIALPELKPIHSS